MTGKVLSALPPAARGFTITAISGLVTLASFAGDRQPRRPHGIWTNYFIHSKSTRYGKWRAYCSEVSLWSNVAIRSFSGLSRKDPTVTVTFHLTPRERWDAQRATAVY